MREWEDDTLELDEEYNENLQWTLLSRSIERIFDAVDTQGRFY